jgi:hypothetical protein
VYRLTAVLATACEREEVSDLEAFAAVSCLKSSQAPAEGVKRILEKLDMLLDNSKLLSANPAGRSGKVPPVGHATVKIDGEPAWAHHPQCLTALGFALFRLPLNPTALTSTLNSPVGLISLSFQVQLGFRFSCALGSLSTSTLASCQRSVSSSSPFTTRNLSNSFSPGRSL